MKAKLKDLPAWEMMGALAELAEPVGNLARDDAFWDAFTECTKRGVRLKQKDTARYILQAYGALFPILMNEQHRMDTFRILAIINGKTVQEVAKMRGAEVLAEAKAVFEETLIPFFTLSGLSDITE